MDQPFKYAMLCKELIQGSVTQAFRGSLTVRARGGIRLLVAYRYMVTGSWMFMSSPEGLRLPETREAGRTGGWEPDRGAAVRLRDVAGPGKTARSIRRMEPMSADAGLARRSAASLSAA